MWNLLGACLLIIILGTFLDKGYYHNGYMRGSAVYQSNSSPTGYAVRQRYYDMETGDTYSANVPVYLTAYNTRPARGTISNIYTTEYGVSPRSY